MSTTRSDAWQFLFKMRICLLCFVKMRSFLVQCAAPPSRFEIFYEPRGLIEATMADASHVRALQRSQSETVFAFHGILSRAAKTYHKVCRPARLTSDGRTSKSCVCVRTNALENSKDDEDRTQSQMIINHVARDITLDRIGEVLKPSEQIIWKCKLLDCSLARWSWSGPTDNLTLSL
jgi:hypothetical protein